MSLGGTGGAGGTGGSGSGGDAGVDQNEGGGGTDGGDGGDALAASCTGVTFVDPAAGATLGAADDSSGDACANGFQYTVVVGVTGTGTVELTATNAAATTSLGSVAIADGQARFANVDLAQGATTLSVTVGDTVCPVTRMVTVDCTLPTVAIVSPATDVALTDPARRLLAATSTQDFRDANPAVPGAQTDVVACTNRLGSANLFAGQVGAAMLTQVGTAQTTVPATPADMCPGGLSFVARFVGVTLPESAENPNGTLLTATAFSVAVTDAAVTTVTTSSDVSQIWVDSTPPTLTEGTPTPLCGSVQAAPTTFTTPVTLNSSTGAVTLSVLNAAPPAVAYGPPTYAGTTATFPAVAFPAGLNTVTAVATEPSGNSTTLAPPAGMTTCTVNVGSAPVVTLVSPAPGSKLCAVGNTTAGCVPDSNLAVPGWQNPISVRVATAGGLPVTTGNVSIVINMGAPETVALDATGNATLAAATIPEGNAVTVTVSTTNAPPVGTLTQTFVVDTLPPAAPTALMATVLDRRQTSFTLGWAAPMDQGQPTVAEYDVRVRTYNPTTMACGAEVRAVPFTTAPKAATMAEAVAVTGLFVENDYCFAVSAADAVGNVSPVVTTNARANFNVTTLMGTGTQGLGSWLDGTADFGGPGTTTADGRADLLVGVNNGQNAYMYFGRTTGYPAAPDVTFTGPAAKRFGQGITAAGDLDADGLIDIAIGAPGAIAADVPAVYIFSRKAAPWLVAGSGWPATLDYTQASYVVTADPSFGGSTSLFGQTMARLGNFDGLGADDLAITASLHDAVTGVDAGRVVILKGSASLASVTLPDPVNTYVIDGQAANDRFGRAVQILPDNTLVISASNATAFAGRVYSFRPPLLPVSVADMTTAFDLTAYGASNGGYGATVNTLGPLGTSMSVVTVGATGPAGNFVDVHLAPPNDGTFVGPKGGMATPTIRFTSSTTGLGLGVVNIGGMIPGTNSQVSFVGGDVIPDLILGGQGEPNRTLYVVNGANIPTIAGTFDLATATTGVIPIRNKVPMDLTTYGRNATPIVDLDGDGYADFAVGEGTSAKPGRAIVFW